MARREQGKGQVVGIDATSGVVCVWLFERDTSLRHSINKGTWRGPQGGALACPFYTYKLVVYASIYKTPKKCVVVLWDRLFTSGCVCVDANVSPCLTCAALREYIPWQPAPPAPFCGRCPPQVKPRATFLHDRGFGVAPRRRPWVWSKRQHSLASLSGTRVTQTSFNTSDAIHVQATHDLCMCLIGTYIATCACALSAPTSQSPQRKAQSSPPPLLMASSPSHPSPGNWRSAACVDMPKNDKYFRKAASIPS